MGEYYATAGYKSTKDMFDDFNKGEANQINGMIGFIKGKGLVKALQDQNFRKFVAGYNGPGNVDNYVSKLKKAINDYKNS